MKCRIAAARPAHWPPWPRNEAGKIPHYCSAAQTAFGSVAASISLNNKQSSFIL